MNQKVTQVDALLSLRGIACLMVVVAHCAPPKSSLIYQNYDLTWLLFSAGGVAVRIFFCLSGYLMGKIFYTERYSISFSGIFKFFRNRVLRIFPLYYFTVFILVLFVYPHLLIFKNWQYLLRICTFTYHQALPVLFNGAFWSLSTEVQFYLMVPLIFIIFKQKLLNQKQVLMVFIAILVFTALLRYEIWLWIIHQDQTPEIEAANFVRYIYTPLFTNLDSFLCGFLVNPLLFSQKTSWTPSIPLFRSKKYLKLIAILLILFLYLSTAYLKYYHQQLLLFVAPTLSATITTVFIFCFEVQELEKFHKKEKLSFQVCLKNPLRGLEILGNLSYGIYVWHLPIITRLAPIYPSEISIEAFFNRLIATIILSSLFATITYYLVEMPAARFKTYQKS